MELCGLQFFVINIQRDIFYSHEYERRSHKKSGNLQVGEDYPEGIVDEEAAAEEGDVAERAGENEFEDGDPIEQEAEVDTTFIGSQTNVISQCPVENGAIRTTWYVHFFS